MLAGSKEESSTAVWAKEKEKAWQAAAVQACRDPTSCRAIKENSVFHDCEKPQVSSVWKYQCISWLQQRDRFQRDIPTSHSLKFCFVLFRLGIFLLFMDYWSSKKLHRSLNGEKPKQRCILFCICKRNVPRKIRRCRKLLSLLAVEDSEAFQVLYRFQLTQAEKVNNKTVAQKY